MTALAPVTVRFFAQLHGFRRDRDLPTTLTVLVTASGVPAADLARSLGLRLTDVEGLFLNGALVGLGATVRPGDRVAFLPYGTPATHPAFFGRAGIEAHASRL